MSWDNRYLQYPVVVDPAWTSTGNMVAARTTPPIAPLPTGRILVAGGGYSLLSAEVYDPATSTWAATGSMAWARQNASALVLPDGRVFVQGGGQYIAETYDVTTGVWSSAGTATYKKNNTANCMLKDGRIFSYSDYNAEVYSASTGWSIINPPKHVRSSRPFCFTMPSGNVLLLGDDATTEIWDPQSDQWSASGSLSTARGAMIALALPGKILVAGGQNGGFLASAELYDVVTGTFSPTGSMSVARQGSAGVYAAGKAYILGGSDGSGALAAVDVYDPAHGTFTAGPNLSSARNGSSAVALSGSQVLVTGPTASAEIYSPLASGCPTSYLSTSPTSPQDPGAMVTLTGSASCAAGLVPEFRFSIRDTSGTWSTVRDWAANPQYLWNTATLLSGTYDLEVDTRQHGSSGGAESLTTQTYGINLPGTCSGAALSPSPSSPQPWGTVVSLNASSSCQSTLVPEYRYWYRDQSQVWHLLDDWSPAASVPWDTSKYAFGTYLLELDGRHQGGASVETTTSLSYTVGGSCPSTSLSTSLPSPQEADTPIVLQATASCPPSSQPIYRFWVTDPQNNTTLLHDWGTQPSLSWDTTSEAAGNYTLKVETSATGNGVDSSATQPFTLSARGPCKPTTISTTYPGPRDASPNTILGSTTCTSTYGVPQFRFWVRDTQSNWTLAQDWSETSSVAWDTTSQPAGIYRLEVDARRKNSGSTFDSYAWEDFTINMAGACTAPALTTNAASPRSPGSTIVFTGASSCSGGDIATYRYWLRDTTQHWSVVRDYATDPNWTWDTTGLVIGSYRIELDISHLGSTASNFDSYTWEDYTLANLGTCVAATMVVAPAGPQPAGTTVQISATSVCSGGASPEYRFWVRDTSGSWTLAQDWSSSASYSWNTTDLVAGNYRLEADERTAGSGATVPASDAWQDYQIGGTPGSCTSTTLAPSLPSPQTHGPTIVLSASSACSSGATPEYRFWVRDTNGNWALVQDWSATSTYSWNTSALPAGSYQLEL
ncbi:MAG: hypothetical protein ACRENE_09280, partial [Polyangiaceae bacterium]